MRSNSFRICTSLTADLQKLLIFTHRLCEGGGFTWGDWGDLVVSTNDHFLPDLSTQLFGWTGPPRDRDVLIFPPSVVKFVKPNLLDLGV